MSNNEIIEGLKQAVQHAKGKGGAKVHKILVPTLSRRSLGLGVAVAALATQLGLPEPAEAEVAPTPSIVRRMDDVVALATRVAVAFAQDNPRIEYDAWADRYTDNVVLKVYHLDECYSLAALITRERMEDALDGDDLLLTAKIKEQWQALTEASYRQAAWDPKTGCLLINKT